MAVLGSAVYYSDNGTPETWVQDETVFSLKVQDSLINRMRIFEFSIPNAYNSVEIAATYFRYQRVRVDERLSGTTIFLGRIEEIVPEFSNETGQTLRITCRGYMQELTERRITANYAAPQVRSAIISSIVATYAPGILNTSIEASGSSETVTRDFTDSSLKALEAIEQLAAEDKWDDVPTGYSYDYYVDNSQRFHYFQRGSKPVGGALFNGMIVELYSSEDSPRIRAMFADHIMPFYPIEILTRVTVYGRNPAGATISASSTDAALETALGIIKEMDFTDTTLSTIAECQARADAIRTLFAGNILRGLIKIVDYPVFRMSPAVTGGFRLGTSASQLGADYLGGPGWHLLRAGELVRVRNVDRGFDEDMLLLRITYVEPEGVAELELISSDQGRGTFGFAVSQYIATLMGKTDALFTAVH